MYVKRRESVVFCQRLCAELGGLLISLASLDSSMYKVTFKWSLCSVRADCLPESCVQRLHNFPRPDAIHMPRLCCKSPRITRAHVKTADANKTPQNMSISPVSTRMAHDGRSIHIARAS